MFYRTQSLLKRSLGVQHSAHQLGARNYYPIDRYGNESAKLRRCIVTHCRATAGPHLMLKCKDYHPSKEEFDSLVKEYGEEDFKNLNIEYTMI